MSKFQIVNMKSLSGISKNNFPYEMLICSGIFTGDDGTVELGEITFMKSPTRPLPEGLQVGKVYEPKITAYSKDGKLNFSITELVLSLDKKVI